MDDAGATAGPVTLSIGASQAIHLNSQDLEDGNAGKGLPEGIGSGQGDWRLTLSSALDIEALPYVRTDDGLVTAMHDIAPTLEDGSHHVAFLNPGSNHRQESLLRLINPGAEAATVRITGTDDAGQPGGSGVTAEVPAGASRTFTAAELESGNAPGLSGALGDGAGKWRLRMDSERHIVAMSLLATPTGHLANLSAPPPAADADGTHVVPLFPSASDPLERQGFLRVVNRSDAAGTVRIEAFDGSDAAYDPVTLSLDAGQARHFNSADLEMGNADKGLAGSTGAGRRDWRLELTSDLDIEVLAYIRTKDGFVTPMHGLAPASADGRLHRIAFFNPASNNRQVSWLRLVNDRASAWLADGVRGGRRGPLARGSGVAAGAAGGGPGGLLGGSGIRRDRRVRGRRARRRRGQVAAASRGRRTPAGDEPAAHPHRPLGQHVRRAPARRQWDESPAPTAVSQPRPQSSPDPAAPARSPSPQSPDSASAAAERPGGLF